jgi:citrate lyase subunit beta / citryl-CoA lyase
MPMAPSKPNLTSVADAITWLFVPGDRPGRFDKALAAGADTVILDLEDAVAPRDKAAARSCVREYLANGGRGCVRVNALGTPWYEDDVHALAGLASLEGIVLPKSESAAALHRVAGDVPGVPLIALIESAAGVLAAQDISASGLVARLALGSLDLALDLDATLTDALLLGPRVDLVLASRAAGLAGPVDGVATGVHDDDGIRRDSRAARELGYAGKLCIHPYQVPLVAAAFMPSPDQVRWAREVVDAVAARRSAGLETAVFRIGADMVDGPVIERARVLLTRAADLAGAR